MIVRGPSCTQSPQDDKHSAGRTQSASHGRGSSRSPPACKRPSPSSTPLHTMSARKGGPYVYNHRVVHCSTGAVVVKPRAQSRRAVGAPAASNRCGRLAQLPAAWCAPGRWWSLAAAVAATRAQRLRTTAAKGSSCRVGVVSVAAKCSWVAVGVAEGRRALKSGKWTRRWRFERIASKRFTADLHI